MVKLQSLSLCALLLLVVWVVGAAVTPTLAAEEKARPNIVWIVSEDNGPYLGCYGCPDADTPHLDRLAREGIVFDNAFSAAPVCAPSRCAIITAMAPPSLGTHHMRSTNLVPPREAPFFVAALREAGYFCTNHSKTDYNLRPVQDQAWDQIKNGNHRQRAEGQPFFAVYNLGVSHESSLHKPIDKRLAEAEVTLPPYHPDTPDMRASWAMYHNVITRMDAQVGEILRQLEDEGVADDTIVFYYSDHAGILPRSKRFLYDTGTRVPLIVRFGKNVAHLHPHEPGTRRDDLVSLIDLGPTVLKLSGANRRVGIHGQTFFRSGKDTKRGYVYAYRDRMDERYDMMRSVRDKRYKYIRNYQPHRIPLQHLDYLWRMPAMRSWAAAYRAGECNALQSRDWQPKAPEELYDVVNDPWEVNNLVDDPACAETLARLRREHHRHTRDIRDAGFLPEAMMVKMGEEAGSIYALVRDDNRYPLQAIASAADLATRGDATINRLLDLLRSDKPAVRYWGAVGLCVLKDQAAPARDVLLRVAREDAWPNVRIAAAEALVYAGEADTALKVLTAELLGDDEWAALHAANVLDAIGEAARPALPALQTANESGSAYVKRATAWTIEKLEK